MRISVVFPQTELGGDAGAVRAYAQRAEELGFTHVLAYDHVVGADLTGETRTPGDCVHALGDGSVSSMQGDVLRGTSPWFPAGVLSGPELRIPRAFLTRP